MKNSGVPIEYTRILICAQSCRYTTFGTYYFTSGIRVIICDASRLIQQLTSFLGNETLDHDNQYGGKDYMYVVREREQALKGCL